MLDNLFNASSQCNERLDPGRETQMHMCSGPQNLEAHWSRLGWEETLLPYSLGKQLLLELRDTILDPVSSSHNTAVVAMESVSKLWAPPEPPFFTFWWFCITESHATLATGSSYFDSNHDCTDNRHWITVDTAGKIYPCWLWGKIWNYKALTYKAPIMTEEAINFWIQIVSKVHGG